MNKKNLNVIAWAITALVALVSALVLNATMFRNAETVAIPNEVATTEMEDPVSGITVTVELSAQNGATLCPSGGVPEMRVWDTQGVMWNSPAPLFVPIDDPREADADVINGTVFCRMGEGMWEGEASPTLVASRIGSDAESIGVHASVNGEERPAFICWDSAAPHRDPMYHRIQFRVGATDATDACYPGTL